MFQEKCFVVKPCNLFNDNQQLWNKKTTFYQYLSVFKLFYKANSFTTHLLNCILSEMIMFELHNCCVN